MLAAALLVLQHVAVVDVTRGIVLKDRAVEIEAGRIHSIWPARLYRPPDGATIMNLPGRYLVPGFIDMHAHALFPPLDSDGRRLPGFDRETAFQMLRALLAYGITTVRDTGDSTEAAVVTTGDEVRSEVRWCDMPCGSLGERISSAGGPRGIHGNDVGARLLARAPGSRFRAGARDG